MYTHNVILNLYNYMQYTSSSRREIIELGACGNNHGHCELFVIHIIINNSDRARGQLYSTWGLLGLS